MVIFESNSLEETKKAAAFLGGKLHSGDVIAYRGGLGAGKTTFTRYLLEALGYEGDVQSPTFSLVNTYDAPIGTVHHYDMYRIKDADDLYSTGFFDVIGTEDILLIEWSENIEEELPREALWITLEPLSETGRRILMEGGDRF